MDQLIANQYVAKAACHAIAGRHPPDNPAGRRVTIRTGPGRAEPRPGNRFGSHPWYPAPPTIEERGSKREQGKRERGYGLGGQNFLGLEFWCEILGLTKESEGGKE